MAHESNSNNSNETDEFDVAVNPGLVGLPPKQYAYNAGAVNAGLISSAALSSSSTTTSSSSSQALPDDQQRELLAYAGRFRPRDVELEVRPRPFLPDYVPAIGGLIDPMLKPPRPDGQRDSHRLGRRILDEPSPHQSDAVLLDLQLRAMGRGRAAAAGGGGGVSSSSASALARVRVIQGGSNSNNSRRAEEISRWIASIGGKCRLRGRVWI